MFVDINYMYVDVDDTYHSANKQCYLYDATFVLQWTMAAPDSTATQSSPAVGPALCSENSKS